MYLYTKLYTFSTEEIVKFSEEIRDKDKRTFCSVLIKRYFFGRYFEKEHHRKQEKVTDNLEVYCKMYVKHDILLSDKQKGF